MGYPIESVVQIRFAGHCNAQSMLTVVNFAVLNPSTLTPGTEEAAIASVIGPGGGQDMVTPYLACCGTNYTMDYVDVQAVYPVRHVRVRDTLVGAVGTGPSTCDAQNTHASLLRLTLLAGRKQRSVLKIPALPKTFALLGLITAGAITAFTALGNALIADIAPTTGGGLYTPVIVHWARPKHIPPIPYGGIDEIESSVVQETVRTQYRRTIGIGK